MSTLLQDLRFGLRMLAKNPGFTAVAVLTLALGIGANAAIFSVINAALLRPLPYEKPDQLVNVTVRYSKGGRPLVIAPDYVAWRDRNQEFQAIEAFALGFNGYTTGANLTGVGEPVRVEVHPVTVGFFSMLGTRPVLGRTFLPEEGLSGHNQVILLSARIWRQQFGGREDVIGKTARLDGTPYTVIGVMPAGLIYPPGDAWVPEVLDATNSLPGSPDFPILTVIGRLKPHASPAHAQSDLQLITRRLDPEFSPGRARGRSNERVEIIPLRTLLVGDARGLLFILLAAVGFVLLIACANIANLLLGRVTARGKEMAVRAALGAGRTRLVGQLLTEGFLLAAGGGLLGLVVGAWAVNALKELIPPNLPADVSLDLRVLTFVIAISFAAVGLFGLVPALVGSRMDLNEALKEGALPGTNPARHRLRNALVVAEIGLSLVLLTGAGLMARSFLRLTNVDPGFDPHHVLKADVWLPVTTLSNPALQSSFFQQVLDRLRALPGVESAAATTHYPPSIFSALSTGISVQGEPPARLGQSISIAYISRDYFRVMGIRLLKGRDFTDRDTSGASEVAIITESVARGVFGDRDPLGRQISFEWPKGTKRTIVGVVADTRNYALERQPWPEIFVPYLQEPSFFMTLVLRTRGDPLAFGPGVRRVVEGVDRNQPVSDIQTMQEIVEKTLAPRQFSMMLLGLFAMLALVLAAVGLYGTISYSVVQRTHEIGVRMALGAGRCEVLKLVVGQGLTLALIGVGVGVAGALALTQFLSSLLYGVKPTDPLTFVLVSVLLTAVALLASFIPARRATKVDPMVALRYE